MSIDAGTRLGPYQILSPLGAGGMGEVYKAKDTRLGRLVAVKVLPEPWAADGETGARFEREARAVAALNHPNILAIHDFATHDGIACVVTELLEGESLRARLAGRRFTPREATELAVQMAHGLAAAHQKGVVHRDLKPDNLWITKDGRLKILDFGLAKQLPAAGAPTDPAGTTATLKPGPRTQTGTILGTFAYMSPEQARGESVDARSDVFSFGAVLFEMLTGRVAFGRNSISDTMAAVLRDDPAEQLTAADSIPAGLQRIVRHCLEKDPGLRFQNAADLAFALQSSVGDGHGVGSQSPAGPPLQTKSRLLPIAVAGAACLLLGAGLAWTLRGAPKRAPAVAIRVLTYSGRDASPAVSPDGKTVAFMSDRDGQSRIWLKQMKGGGEAVLTSGRDDFPRFSPDGASVLFIRTLGQRTSLQRITLLETEPHKVVDDADQADWSPDGRQIAFVRSRSPQDTFVSSLHLIDMSGANERELAHFQGDLVGFPRWSPDGRYILLNTPSAITSGVLRKLILVDTRDGKSREIGPPSLGLFSSAAWASPDEIVFLLAESITAGGTAGSAARGFRENIHSRRVEPLFWTACWGSTLDLFADGRVIFDGMSSRQNLRLYDLRGQRLPRWLTHGTTNDRQPVFSPDGEWVVFSSNRSGNLDLWATSTATGVVRSITDDPADDWDPAFSPDGRSLLWSSNRTGNLEIWSANTDGSGAHQVTHDGEDAQNPTQTRDGAWIIYSCANRSHPGLWKIHPDGTGAEQIAKGAVQIPEISPDGRYAGYMITYRAGAALYVVRLADGAGMTFAALPEPRRKSAVFACRSRWTPDGKQILFTGQDTNGLDGIFIQDFRFGEDTSATRNPLVGFDPDWISESMGLSPDGKQLVLSESERVFSIVVAEGLAAAPRREQGKSR